MYRICDSVTTFFIRVLIRWGDRRGSNPRQPESQSGTLPTELQPPLSRHAMCYMMNVAHGKPLGIIRNLATAGKGYRICSALVLEIPMYRYLSCRLNGLLRLPTPEYGRQKSRRCVPANAPGRYCVPIRHTNRRLPLLACLVRRIRKSLPSQGQRNRLPVQS